MLISDRIGFRRDDDPLARLPLVGTFLGIAVLLFYPAYNAIERGVEWRTDRLALRAITDRSAGVRLFVRRADDDLVALVRPPHGALVLRIAPAAGLAHRRDRQNRRPLPALTFGRCANRFFLSLSKDSH